MIARWMLAATVFAALCGVAAYAAERAMRALRRPTRWPWVMALVIGAAWPAIAPFVLTARVADASADGGSVTMKLIPLAAEAPASALLNVEQLEAPLRAAWAIGSALLLLQIAFAIRTIRRVQRGANAQAVHGEAILVNEHMGPAVIGVLRPQIVVPTWLLELDDSLRALILRHEREHCRAGDPALVWLGVATTTLFPFNAALWWISRRLRLAMEIDCDARTLHGEPDPSRYAKLLLLIAQQSHSARFAPMLSHSPSQLARRIRAMQNPVTRFRMVRVVAATVFVVGAGAAACSSRVASNLTSPAPAQAPATTVAAEPPTVMPQNTTYFDFQVEQTASLIPGSRAPRYPEALRKQGVSGTVLGQFVVNEDGSVDTSTIKVVKSPHPDLSASVREALTTMRFKPALVGGRGVRQLVQTPFEFSLDSPNGTGRTGEARQMQPTKTASASPKVAGIEIAPTGRPVADSTGNGPAKVAGFVTAQKGTTEEADALNHSASAKPDNPSPEYPTALRQAGVKGLVLTQFVVNSDGSVDVSSLKVLKSDHDEFTQSVRKALPSLRFEPAMVNGRAVRQLMQMPFEFSLDRN